MPEDKTKTSETKIVKAAPKKETAKENSSSKVQIRAVDVAIIEAQRQKAKKVAQPQTQKSQTAAKPAAPAGKPMTKAQSQAQSSSRPVPFGKPMPKNAVPKKKSEVPQKPAAETVAEVVPEEKIQEAAPVVEEVKETVAAEAAPVVETVVEEKTAEISAAEEKKEAEIVPEEAAAPAEVKEEKTEAPKKEEKPAEKPAPKKYVPKVDYTPGIGLKIISRAADQPKEEKKPVQPKKNNNERRDNRDNKSGRDRNNQGSNGQDKRKPKEFVGKKPQGQGASAQGADKTSPRKKDFQGKTVDGKVVAYTAPANDSRRKKKGKNDKNYREEFEYNPEQLAKTEHKKHSKYKEKVEEPVESAIEIEAKQTNGIIINCPITVAGFCEQVEKSTSEVVMTLMKMGIMANVNQNLDEETAVLLGIELNLNILVNKAEEVVLEEGIDTHEDAESELKERPPIITVMGHVDHGKTSLLDAIRKTNVTAGEAGGITQAIGASEVVINGQKIVFLDTPGHEAFTAMRARGAHVTDIAVLVVAADDSVMPQTIESISHAKAAGVPIIVAINKMDKPGANPDRVKKDLADNGVLVEDWGGNVISVPVSAKKGEGIQQLLEMILLQAEMLELKANPDRMASGTVIEARLDKNKGPVATLLVMNGTLQAGAAVVAGTACGRIRVMTDFKGSAIRKATPATAVEITGLTEVPEAGDEFYMVKDEKTAREIAEGRKMKLREEVLAKNSSTSLEKLFSQLKEGEVKDLNIIIKADVQGSVGALEQSLEKLHNDSVRVKIVHTGVGAINESDVMLAETSGAIIIGFNVRPSTGVRCLGVVKDVEIRTYRIIYEIIEDIEAAMKGMLKPEFKEVVLGKVEVRETFKVPNVGIIAGAYVIEGKAQRNASVRLVRDGIVIHEGSISSLKRFKDDAKEVAQGYECGIGIEKFNDIKIGDIIECYTMQEVERD